MISQHSRFYGNVKLGKSVRIDDGVIITGDVEIGDYVHIGPYSVLHGRGGIRIGDYCGFSAFTTMFSESDDFSGRSMFGPCIPVEYKPHYVRGGIVIGRCVFVGCRVTILPGVKIGNGVSIGAHSLVKSDCEPESIYAGTPAKKVKARDLGVWDLVKKFELEVT